MLGRKNMRWNNRCLSVAAGLLLLLAFTGTPASGESHGEQTIAGEIFAEEYNGEGEVTVVSIFDEEWGTVTVSPAGRGHELLARVGALVEATGEIEESEEGDYVISVKSYRVIDEDESAPELHDEGE